MKIQTLTISDFRCFKHYHLEFTPGTTIVIGRNGAGKSTLIDALHSVSSLPATRNWEMTSCQQEIRLFPSIHLMSMTSEWMRKHELSPQMQVSRLRLLITAQALNGKSTSVQQPMQPCILQNTKKHFALSLINGIPEMQICHCWHIFPIRFLTRT